MNKLPHQSLGDQMLKTPAGLLVTAPAFDSLVKAQVKTETRQIAAEEEKKRAALFSYLASNMALYGAREKPQGTPSFRSLYAAAKQSFIDAILIRTRIDEMKRVWQPTFSEDKVGFRVVHDRHDDKDFKGSRDIDARCREMTDMIADPCPERFTDFYPHRVRPHTRLKDLISVLTRAELIIDRKVIRRYKRSDGKGYAAFHWLPGETIKNVDEAMKEWALKNEKTKTPTSITMQRMSQATNFDLTKASYVQIIDGMIVDAFSADEISIHISNPSDEVNMFGYGTSRLEMSLEVTAVLMYAWQFNREMFKTNYPEAILSISGDYDKEGLQAFKQQLMGETHGPGNYWRLPVIPAGDKDNFKIEAHKLRDTPKDMLFDQFVRLLLMVKSAAYGMHPSKLNMQIDSGGGGSMFGTNPTEQIEQSKEISFEPAITDMCEWFTDAIIKPRYPDLKVILDGLDKEDEKQAVDIRTARTSKWMTKNEARLEEGKAVVGFWVEPEQIEKLDEEDTAKYMQNPWNYPADVPITNYLSTFQMAQQDQEEQAGPSEDDEDNGGGDWDDQEANQYYQGNDPTIQKSRRDVRFLEVTIGGDD